MKPTKQCGSNDNTDLCPEVTFGKGPRRVETSTLTCLAMWWVGLYMVQLLILEGIFQQTVIPQFEKAFSCHFDIATEQLIL